jgi:hypothetical protein
LREESAAQVHGGAPIEKSKSGKTLPPDVNPCSSRHQKQHPRNPYIAALSYKITRAEPDSSDVVYTLPAAIADIAYQNKAVIYDLLLKASAETTLTIAADPKHLGARIGFISVLHTWGSALTQHPHS